MLLTKTTFFRIVGSNIGSTESLLPESIESMYLRYRTSKTEEKIE